MRNMLTAIRSELFLPVKIRIVEYSLERMRRDHRKLNIFLSFGKILS